MPDLPVSVDRFLAVSTTLVGAADLDRQLASEYLERVVAAPEAAALQRLTETLETILAGNADGAQTAIKEHILGDVELGPLAQLIILLWYLGELHGQKPAGGHPEHYFRGLFWQVVRAHPPALSGGYSGYWAYPPEN